MSGYVMGTIIPQIFKWQLPKTLRWAVQYSDVATCFASRADADILLDPSFIVRDAGNIASSWGGPSDDGAPDALHLITLAFDPERDVTQRFKEPPYADGFPVLIHVSAIPRAHALAQHVHREQVRGALSTALDTIAAGPAWLFSRRWVLQPRACPEPPRLESLTTVWSGLRREATQSRVVPLRVEPVAG